jgi:hypothetical protein
MGWGRMNWIFVAQYRNQWRALVNTVMNLQVPLKYVQILSGLATGGFSRRTHLHEVKSLTDIYMSYMFWSVQKVSLIVIYIWIQHHNFTCVCYKYNNYLIIYSTYMASPVQAVYSGLYFMWVSYSYSSNLVTWRKVEPRIFRIQV